MRVAAKSPLTLLGVRRMRRFWGEIGADVVDARSRVPAWVAYLAWRGMGEGSRPRLVTTVHGLHSVSGYSAVMTRGEAVVAVSRSAERYVLENYPKVERSRVRVIARGVDPAEFPHGFVPGEAWREEWERAFPVLTGKKLVTIVGRLTRLKGHHEFLTVVSRLRGLGVHGVIVGGEDPRRAGYARELRERVAREGLGGCVTFTGHREDVREIASVSEVVVSLSTKPESFGRSVLEALRLGTPVLGWDHGGVGEVLGAVYPAGAVRLGDVEGLCARAEGLLSGEKSLVPASGHFTKAEMLERTVGLYEELAGSA